MKQFRLSRNFTSAILLLGAFILMSCAHQQNSETEIQGPSLSGAMSGEDTGDKSALASEINSIVEADGSDTSQDTENSLESESRTSAVPDNMSLASSDVEAVAADEMSDDQEVQQAEAKAEEVTESEPQDKESVDLASLSEEPSTSESVDTVTPPVAVAKSHPARKTALRTPSKPSSSTQLNGTLLNRFYILRTGDSAESVSKLFYGSPAREKDLSSWNTKKWAPGSVVLYNSPLQPVDSQMRSFYEERGVKGEEYSLKKGETLFSLAKNRFGHVDSWKEIGLLNQIEYPNTVKQGSKLVLMPKELTQYAFSVPGKTSEIKAQANANPAAAIDSEIRRLEKNIATMEQTVQQPPSEEVLAAAMQEMKSPEISLDEKPLLDKKPELKKEEAKLANPDMTPFFRKHLAFILAALLVVGCGLYWAWRRTRKEASETSEGGDF